MVDALEDIARMGGWEMWPETIVRCGGVPEELHPAFVEVYRASLDLETALAAAQLVRTSDVTHFLPDVRCPTLVLHCRGTLLADEQDARELTAGIEYARLLLVDAVSHPPFVEDAAIVEFLAEGEEAAPAARQARTSADARLSPREIEVLRLIADGRSNAKIAEALVISPNTVARHEEHPGEDGGGEPRGGHHLRPPPRAAFELALGPPAEMAAG